MDQQQQHSSSPDAAVAAPRQWPAGTARQRKAPTAAAAAGAAPIAVQARDDAAAQHQQKQHQHQQQQQAVMRQVVVLVACAGWLVASSGAILINKRIMVDLSCPYPGLVGALGLCGTTLICQAAVRLLHLDDAGSSSSSSQGGAAALGSSSPMTPRRFLTTIAPTGLCLALSMHLGNTAYLHLSVAYIQMLKAFTPVVTMAVACALGVERPCLRLGCAVTLIAGGVALASAGEGALNVPGLSAMAGSMVCEALRLVLTQRMVSGGGGMHPLRTLSYLAPAAAAWMLLLFGGREAAALARQDPPPAVLEQPGLLLSSAAAGFAVNASALAVIALTGALTLKCLALAKDVGLVLYGAAALGEAVSGLQAAGYCVSLAGFAAYNAIKMGLLGGGSGGSGHSGSGAEFRRSECVTAADAAAAAAGSAPAGSSDGSPAGKEVGVRGGVRARRPGRAATVAAAED